MAWTIQPTSPQVQEQEITVKALRHMEILYSSWRAGIWFRWCETVSLWI